MHIFLCLSPENTWYVLASVLTVLFVVNSKETGSERLQWSAPLTDTDTMEPWGVKQGRDCLCNQAALFAGSGARYLFTSQRKQGTQGSLPERLSSQYAGVSKVMCECNDQLHTCAVQHSAV